MLGHSQRVSGFREVMQRRYPEMEFLGLIETNDDDICAFEETSKLLCDHPEMDALFIAAGGAYGVCRAVLSSGRRDRITIVSFDTVPTTVEMLESRLIKATICQQPEVQGYQAVKSIFDFYIGRAVPADEQHLIRNEIKYLRACFSTTMGTDGNSAILSRNIGG